MLLVFETPKAYQSSSLLSNVNETEGTGAGHYPNEIDREPWHTRSLEFDI